VVGFAAAIYFAMWIFQIPVGKYLDRNHGDRDDFWFLVVGAFITSMVPFLYLFASLPVHVYLLQALMGLGRAIDLPPWYAIFTRRIDKSKEGFDWSIENVVVGLGLAATGALGGTVAKWYGYETVFVLAGILSIIGSSILLLIHKYAYAKEETV
jgi:MFS family permease